jgi:large subunit ribosomal protein L4
MIAIPVRGSKSQSPETMQLSADIERKEESPKTFACAIRSLLQNWRQGTVGCKTRGEVAFSNKKPWRQKGTGRARVSSIRSPLWRKGGIIFGPQPRVRTLSLHLQQRRLVFNNIFFAMLDKNGIACLDFEIKGSKPSAKTAQDVLRTVGLLDKKIVLFLPFGDELHAASFRNMPNVTVVLFDQPNAYHLNNAHNWVFLKKDMDFFNKMVAQWN